jgi:hypothetical protein
MDAKIFVVEEICNKEIKMAQITDLRQRVK